MTKIDPTWPDGPWDEERDHESWRHSCGYFCHMVRHPEMGTWCGYVAIPDSNSLYGVDMMDMPDGVHLAAHQGVTWTRQGDGDFWIVGFDCGHFCDVVPGLVAVLASVTRKVNADLESEGAPIPSWTVPSYKDAAYVQDRTNALAEALHRYDG